MEVKVRHAVSALPLADHVHGRLRGDPAPYPRHFQLGLGSNVPYGRYGLTLRFPSLLLLLCLPRKLLCRSTVNGCKLPNGRTSMKPRGRRDKRPRRRSGFLTQQNENPVEHCRPDSMASPHICLVQFGWWPPPRREVVTIMKISVEFSLEELLAVVLVTTSAIQFFSH